MLRRQTFRRLTPVMPDDLARVAGGGIDGIKHGKSHNDLTTDEDTLSATSKYC